MKSFEALEEIARLEQRSSLKRGKFLTLFNTHAVKSLGYGERKEFFDYLRSKKAKNILLVFILAASLGCFFAFKSGLTGEALAEVGNEIGVYSWIFVAVFGIALLIVVYEMIMAYLLERRFKRHIILAEKVIR